MNFNGLIMTLFGITSVGYILHLGFYLICASMYDVRQQARLLRNMRHRQVAEYAALTILVPAHNEELVIERCLDSIAGSSYPKIEIIVVNDASTDGTRRILERYKRCHPSLKLQTIHKRHNIGKGGALNYALRRYVRTDFVMMLDADSILSSDAAMNAMSYFSDDKIVGVAANVQIMNQHTTLSILQKFEHMIGYRSKKAYSLTNCEFVIGGVASTYRMAAIRRVHFYDTDTLTEDISLSIKLAASGNRQNRLVYGVDVMAMTEPVESFRALLRQRYRWKYGSLQNIFKHIDLIEKNDSQFSAMLTLYRMPMAVLSETFLLCMPLIWTYIIYLTMAERSLVFILGAYLTITIYMFVTLWFDEHLGWRERGYLTLYVPLAYFIFYIMDYIQIVAVVRCIFKLRSIMQRKEASSAWVSPQRIGGTMQLDSPIVESLPATERSHG